MSLLRAGNARPSQVQFELSHGATPSRLTALYPFPLLVPIAGVVGVGVNVERLYYMQVGANQWFGKIEKYWITKTNDGGYQLHLEAIDLRDELWSNVVFAQINMIDEFDGSIYSIVDITATGNQAWGSQDWFNQRPNFGYIAPKQIVEWLFGVAGFDVSYSAAALNVLNIADYTSTPWTSSIYNVYNIDWNLGIKVGQAVEEILEKLGLQFTVDMDVPPDIDSKLVHITLIGDADYPGVGWEALSANEVEDGEGLQTDVDTHLYVVGEKNLYELTDHPLVPAW